LDTWDELILKAGVIVVVVDDVGILAFETVPLGIVLLVNNISRIRDSIGVLPTKRTKKISLITCELTNFNAGRRRSNLPKRFICEGY
jgi:hypothetical protein